MAKTRAIIGTFFVIVATMTAVGCNSGTQLSEKAKIAEAPAKKTVVPKIRISADGALEQCRERGLEDKFLLVVSRYCPKCKRAKPIIEKVIGDEKLESYYETLDVSFHSERQRLKAYNIEVQFVPTFIANCYAYVGARNKEQYNDIMKAYKLGL
jgi:hypothetical protein